MQGVEDYRTFEPVQSSLLPWIVCLAATLIFFYEFIQGNMFASIADSIMRDFHIQADKMAYLSSGYYLSNVIFLFVAGLVLDRFSIKNIILFAMMLCVVSTFVFAASQSFYVALLCRFVTGIGSAFCFLGPVRLASRWFPPQRMALVTGVIVTMAMTGGMLAQYPMTVLVEHVGWRHALQWLGWLGIAMFGLMVLFVKDKPATTLHKKAQHLGVWASIKKAYLSSQTLSAALYTSLMNMAIAVYGAMIGKLYLEQRLGVSAQDASVVNSMLFLGAIIGGPLIGWYSDKIQLRVLPMKISVIISLCIALAILYFPVSYGMMGLLFFLLGFFTSAQVISYALVAESCPPTIIAMAVSAVSILTQGGFILYQNLFSKLLLSYGGMTMENGVPVYSLGAYQYAAIILPIGLILAFFSVLRLKETHCRHIEIS